MKVNSGMQVQERETIAETLAKLLADLYTTYLKTQNFHWNLTGKEFYSLHIMSEKQYEELADVIDEVAERIRALGFYVDGSLSGFQQLTSIKELRKTLPLQEMLEDLLHSQETAIQHARHVGNLADKHHDHATVDFIGRLLNTLEKFAWMVRSHLA